MLYPDPDCRELRRALADFYGVGTENIFVSNGSDDILNFAFMAFSEKGAVFPDITYGFYTVFAALHGIKYTEIPLKEDFSIDAEDYTDARGRLIAIANPNAPTGMCLSTDEIEKIAAANPNSVVLIDEAYVDFGAESCAGLTKKYKNLLVVMTYSKSRSLAGARLGFAIADSCIIRDLNTIKFSTNPYSINRLSMKAGIAALSRGGAEYYGEKCAEIVKTREYTAQRLRQTGFDVLESKANFIFVKSAEINGEKLYSELKKRGVLVRHFTKERIKNYNRITIGTKEQMDVLLSCVKNILQEVKK